MNQLLTSAVKPFGGNCTGRQEQLHARDQLVLSTEVVSDLSATSTNEDFPFFNIYARL